MTKSCDTVLVLWGEYFDEATAVVLITVLREAGLRVKVVGLTPRQISGAHGLALVPDVSLDQALPLARNAICVVVPAALPGFKRVTHDPRVIALLQHAQTNQAKFVLGSSLEAEGGATGLYPPAETRVLVYPECEELVRFARKLAGSLMVVGPER